MADFVVAQTFDAAPSRGGDNALGDPVTLDLLLVRFGLAFFGFDNSGTAEIFLMIVAKMIAIVVFAAERLGGFSLTHIAVTLQGLTICDGCVHLVIVALEVSGSRGEGLTDGFLSVDCDGIGWIFARERSLSAVGVRLCR